MIMFFLPWWTYVLIGTVVFACSFGAVWLANIAQPGVEQPGDGPFPCGAHLGTDEDGAEDWCWQLAGHDGDHLGMRQYFDAELPEWPVPAWLAEGKCFCGEVGAEECDRLRQLAKGHTDAHKY